MGRIARPIQIFNRKITMMPTDRTKRFEDTPGAIFFKEATGADYANPAEFMQACIGWFRTPVHVRLGVGQNELAGLLGVDERNFRRWLSKGEDALGGMPDSVQRQLIFFLRYPAVFNQYRGFIKRGEHLV